MIFKSLWSYLLRLAVAGLLPFALSQPVLATGCEELSVLTDYGIIGESDFTYGRNSEINDNDISGSGNTPTPTGVTETIDLDFPEIDPSTFPATGGVDLELSSSTSIDSGSYGSIDFEPRRGSGTLTFTGGDYYIDELEVKSGSTIQLAPGNYFISDVTFENNTALTISPAGQVNIYIENSFQAGNQSELNVNGDTGNLTFYLYDSASFQVGNSDQGSSNIDFNGIIYSPYTTTSIQFGNNNDIVGAILSAGTVDVGNNTTFDYDSSVQAEVIDAFGCDEIPNPDHYLISHGGIGVTCEAEAITIVAHDATDNVLVPPAGTTITLSTSIANNGWTLKSGNGTFTAPNQYSFDGAESSVEFWLRKTTATVAPHIDIDVDDGVATDKDDGGIEDPALEFRDAALRFYADGVADSIGTQIAGKFSSVAPGAQALELRAVQTNTDTGACEARITGTQTLQMAFECVSPASCKTANGVTLVDAIIGGTGDVLQDNPSGAGIAYSNVQLTFDNNGIATWRINYSDAGQIRLHANLDIPANGSDPAATLSGTSNTFPSVPAGLCVETSDFNAECPSGDGSCSAFKKVDENFNLGIKAVQWQTAGEADSDFCSGNAIAPNFQLSGIVLAPNLIAPSGSVGSLGVGSFDFLAGDNGEHVIATQQLAEVGVFTITAVPPNYFGETIASSTSANIGRFTPDHFITAVIANGALQDACTGFTYIGQNFSYDPLDRPIVAITAADSLGNTTVNYRDDFVKLTDPATQIVMPAVTEDSSNFGADGSSFLALGWTPGISSLVANNNGMLTFTLGNDVFSYLRDSNSLVAPFVSDIDLKINSVVDSDAITATGMPQTISPTGIELRYGQLLLDNVYGPETLPLTLTLRGMYYNGTSFVTNALDSCTAYDSVNLSLSNYQDNLNSPETVASGSGSLAAGIGTAIQLSAPGLGNDGSVDLALDLSSATGADLEWLRPEGSDPTAKVTFGIYRGSDFLIYMRELIQ